MEFTLQFNTNKFSVFRPLFLTFSIKLFSNPSSTIQNPYQLVYMYRFFFVTLSYIILIDGLFVKYCDCSCQQLTKSLHKTTFFIIVFFFFLNLVFKLMIRNIYIYIYIYSLVTYYHVISTPVCHLQLCNINPYQLKLTTITIIIHSKWQLIHYDHRLIFTD